LNWITGHNLHRTLEKNFREHKTLLKLSYFKATVMNRRDERKYKILSVHSGEKETSILQAASEKKKSNLPVPFFGKILICLSLHLLPWWGAPVWQFNDAVTLADMAVP
jgi:hypothetical protein